MAFGSAGASMGVFGASCAQHAPAANVAANQAPAAMADLILTGM
jgi:hypothetical protein